jgi:hypothetical protein
MELLNFTFRLGVVFAIFGFIWGLINIGVRLLTIGRTRQTTEIYILKAVQYLLLVDVTFLICDTNEMSSMSHTNQLVFGAFILLMYFVGKLQRRKEKQIMIQFYANGLMRNETNFNLKAEIAVISLAIAAYLFFWTQPTFASNPLSLWFRDSILDIEETPIFGFIFKVIGFFFLVNIVLKVVNAFLMILTGRAFDQTSQHSNDRKEDEFDDFEELN